MQSKYLCLLCLIFFLGCDQKRPGGKMDTQQEQVPYFSIMQFAKDQFKTYWGYPVTLEKIVVENGKRDSSLVSVDLIDWGSILGTFFATDISDKKYLGRYQVSVLTDDISDSRINYYEATDERLFTRTLQITTDPGSNRVRSVYIETEKNGATQKLYYAPLKLIQIQQFSSSFLGGSKNIKTEYRFLQ